MKKNIIFDFDGTIANSFNQTIQIIHNLQHKAGYNYSKDELAYILRHSTYEKLFKKFKISKIKQIYLIHIIRKEIKKDSNSIKPYPHIIKTLQNFAKTHDLYLLTSNQKENVEPFLNTYNLQIFKNKVYGVGLLGKKEKIKKLKKKFNLKTKSTFYIGDELRDFKASKFAEITPLIVTWGYNSQEFLKKNHIKNLINSPKELTQYFK